ncbi:unnamed protein product [Cuscuta campestris]|uniref:WAT1-related protein n=1 Tax=Cuscuta campestris TaxID=132261 RepID=A0A484KI21_9ASTE|nr:unnamed protein product [Cuscuta campestris]
MATFQSTAIGLCIDRTEASWKLGWNLQLITILYSGVLASAATLCLVFWAIAKRGPTYPSMFNPLSLVFVAITEAIFFGASISVGSSSQSYCTSSSLSYVNDKAPVPDKDSPPVMKSNPSYETWMIVDAQNWPCLLAIVSPTVTHKRLHGLRKGTDFMQKYIDTALGIVTSLKLDHELIPDNDLVLHVLRVLLAEYASLKQNV